MPRPGTSNSAQSHSAGRSAGLGAAALMVAALGLPAICLAGAPTPPPRPTSPPAASAPAAPPSPAAVASAPVPAEPPLAQPGPAVLAQRLDQALAGELPLAEVRLDARGFAADGPRWLTLFGEGVGIWNRTSQFVVPPEKLKGALALLKETGFCAMPDGFGGGRPAKPTPAPSGPQILRELTLAIGDASKSVAQINRGEQSAVFEGLVKRMLELFEKEGSAGVKATDLADGLEKLANGTLAPVALTITVHCPQMRSSVAPPAEGWLLHLTGRRVEAQVQSARAGYSQPRRYTLSESDFKSLVALLLANRVATLPANLYDNTYTDLVVAVLGHEKNVQAQVFADKTPKTDSERHAAFEAIRAGLHQIHQTAVRASGF